MSKLKLCIDFDGVIHSYTSKWVSADVIPDPPVEGAAQFIADAAKVFDIYIFSTRSHQLGGIKAMTSYITRMFNYAQLSMPNINFPTSKPPVHVSIDDRGWLFEGEWPSIDELVAFKPWNKRGKRNG